MRQTTIEAGAKSIGTETTMDENFIPDCLAPYAPGSICYYIDCETGDDIVRFAVTALSITTSGVWRCTVAYSDHLVLSSVFTSFEQARQALIASLEARTNAVRVLEEPAPAQE